MTSRLAPQEAPSIKEDIEKLKETLRAKGEEIVTIVEETIKNPEKWLWAPELNRTLNQARREFSILLCMQKFVKDPKKSEPVKEPWRAKSDGIDPMDYPEYRHAMKGVLDRAYSDFSKELRESGVFEEEWHEKASLEDNIALCDQINEFLSRVNKGMGFSCSSSASDVAPHMVPHLLAKLPQEMNALRRKLFTVQQLVENDPYKSKQHRLAYAEAYKMQMQMGQPLVASKVLESFSLVFPDSAIALPTEEEKEDMAEYLEKSIDKLTARLAIYRERAREAKKNGEDIEWLRQTVQLINRQIANLHLLLPKDY